MADLPKDIKIKQKLSAPPQASPYVINLPQPPIRNAEEFLKAYIGYIYTAVGAIAQEVASIDLHLYQLNYVKGKPTTKEIFEHPILSILDYVNQLSTFYDVVEATQIYLELTGEAFWVVLKEGTTPVEFWLLRPDWVKVIPSPTDVIDHYNYYAGGIITEVVEIPKQNIIPFKYFHPMNPYRGKGATQAAALPFDILNFAQEYNRNFFFNSAIPSMVFTSEQKISEQTTKRFLQQWQESFGGRTKSNKIAFLGNGLKLDKASFAAKELDFTEQMKNMRDDVLAVFKVPKTVLGLTEDVNRANATATTTAFMERVVTPRMRKFIDALNEFFLPMFADTENLFLDFTDPAPEDVDMKLKKYASGLGAYGAKPWMTQNEVRAEENLPPLPGGDELGGQAPAFGQQPTTTPSDNTPPEEPNDANPDETPNDQNPDEPVKPTGEEDSMSSWRKAVIRVLGGKVPKKNGYVPPAYLEQIRNRPVKHMVKIPQKKLEDLEKEKLAAEFVAPLKKFIGQLLALDDYSALLKADKKKRMTKEAELAHLIAEGLKKKSEANKESAGWTDEAKDAYWKAFIQHVTKREGQIKEKCKMVFSEQKQMVLNNLEDQMKGWRQRLGTKATAKTVVPSLEDLNKMWKVLTDILREIYIEQGNYTLDFLGANGTINITTEFASQYLVEYGGQLITQIDSTTRDQLMQELSDGFDQGESVTQLADRVKTVFATADEKRAEDIARTEAIRASNAATVEAYRQSDVVVAKEWLAERDTHTCPLCEELDGKAIPLDDNYFDQGDSKTIGNQTFKFDFTDVGEPPAHTDCRCTTIPVIDTSQQGEPSQ